MSGNVPSRSNAGPSNPLVPLRSQRSANRREVHSPIQARPPKGAPKKSPTQILEQVTRTNKLVIQFHFESRGPGHNQEWKATFKMGDRDIGVSGWKPRKSKAKEEAAQDALSWLAGRGYH